MADLSPELASRIQSLEASYADNPGRYFVALAGAWREGGDIARAEQILRENLKHFPSLSPHVLLGRCLADRGAFPEAANEFHYVLSIDPQNLIALRTLAEMAAAEGRRADAEKWYHELLSVDPMNSEARAALQQLARMPEVRAAAPAPAEPGWGDVDLAPAPVDAEPATDDGEFGMIDLSAPDASPADASGVAADDDAEGGEWGDLTLDAAPAPPAAPTASTDGDLDAFGFVDLDAEPSADAEAPPANSEGWMDTDARQDVGERADEDASALPMMDDGMLDAPLAGADLPLLDFSDDVEEDDDDLASAASQPGAGFGFDDAPAQRADDGHGEVDAEMVTETMAELYASQGLLARAADVYRELIGQRGEEAGLVRRLAEIESRMGGGAAQPALDFTPEPADAPAATAAPDWLESVDAFARGGAEGAPDEAPAAADGTDGQDAQDGLLDFHLDTDGGDAARADANASTALDPLVFEPADEFAAAIPASGSIEFTVPGTVDAAEDADDGAPEFAPAASSASVDPFADSFAGGFGGAEAEPAAVSNAPEDERQAWQAPQVTETEPVGFDILVVADEDGTELPASPEVAADASADWAMAAAPLGGDEEHSGEPGDGVDVPAAAEPVRAGRTMRGYFDSLLAWAPPAPDAPTYEVTADSSGAIVIEPAEDAVADDAGPAGAASPGADALTAAAGADVLTVADDVPSAVGTGDGSAEDEPWAATPEDEPWAAVKPGESAPDGIVAPAPEELPRLDLEEPWAEAPAPPAAEFADIGAFAPADDAVSPAEAEPASAPDADAEELLPWEVPAEPAAATPEAQADGGGFSFEDFFAGAPGAPAAPAPMDAPAEPTLPPSAAAPAEAAESSEPAFIPSFAEPTPPPVFEEAAPAPSFAAPAPPPVPAPAAPAPAPAAPAASGGQDEDDEDLESFQAWLQSLKR